MIIRAAALCLLFAAPLLATQPNPSARQRELIDELLTLTKPEELMRQGVDQMLAQMQKSMDEQAGDPKTEGERHRRDEAAKDFDHFRELVRESIDYKQLVRDIYLPLYAKYFNEQQLAEIIAFHKSPAGQRFIKVQPDLQSEAMLASSAPLKEKMAAIMKQLNDDHAKRRPWEKTMRDIRILATAIEAWATDHDGKYPPSGTLDNLRKELQPYVKEMPEKDSWGTAYAYVVSPERDHYRIVSAGADSVFDWDSRRIVVPKKKDDDDDDDEPELKYGERLEDDIIYADGSFLQIPRAAQHDQ